MSEDTGTRQHFFEESISILFWLGQFPVILISLLTVVCVASHFHAAGSWRQGAAYVSGVLALALSLASVTKLRRSKRLAICLLTASLVLTLLYLTLLVRITRGSGSPFQHLYLYLPAVVFMVAQRRRWAEVSASLGVLLSYCVNHGNAKPWEAWDTFHECSCFWWYETVFFVLLLVFLILVNVTMEKLIRKEYIANGKKYTTNVSHAAQADRLDPL